MHRYGIEQFLLYYGDSYIADPESSKPARIERSEQANQVRVGGKIIDLKDLDWEHVRTPPLGYRHLHKGRLLVYLVRRPASLTRKGVCADAITVHIPEEVNFCLRELNESRFDRVDLDKAVAEAMFCPKFIKLKFAIKSLITTKTSVGFALSHEWAVSLGTCEEEALVLHFSGHRAATSSDGDKWSFISQDIKELFHESFS